MASGQRRDATKERRWREVLGRQASSGLSVREFCRRERLSEASFYAKRLEDGTFPWPKANTLSVEIPCDQLLRLLSGFEVSRRAA